MGYPGSPADYLTQSIFYVPGQVTAALISLSILVACHYLQSRRGNQYHFTHRQILLGLGIFFALTLLDLPTTLGRCPGSGLGSDQGKPPQIISDPLGITILTFGYLAGLLTFFSPCGLPMFPGYVSLYLGSKPSLLKTTAGGLSAAAGMAAAFAAITLSTYSLGSSLSGYAEILELAGGLIALLMGIFMIAESRILRLPSRVRAPEQRGLRGLFSFGAIWGLAEIVCTPYLFISVLVFAIAEGLRGILSFVGFGLGMILPIIFLTLITVKGRQSAVTRLLRYVPTLHRISSLIIFFLGVILVSLSLLYYGVL